MLQNTDYLSKQTTQCLKGIFALLIIVGHLKNYTEIFSNNLFGKVLGLLAYLVVGGFFFISAYGIVTQAKAKGINYIKTFPLTRMLPLYCVSAFFGLINLILPLIDSSKSISTTYILCTIFIPGYGIGFGWYIQVLFLLYVIFWIVLFCFPYLNKTIAYLVITTICFLLLFLLKPMLWWQSLLAFLLGCLWAEHKEKIDIFLSKRSRYALTLTISITITIITILYGNLNSIEAMWQSKVLKTLSVPLFITTVVLILHFININNIATRMLGEISLEMYCVQMIFMTLFHSKYVYIENDIIYWLVTIICILAFSLLVHPIVKFINLKAKIDITKKNPSHNGGL